MTLATVKPGVPSWLPRQPDFAVRSARIQPTSPSAFSVVSEAHIIMHPARPADEKGWLSLESLTARGIDTALEMWASVIAGDLLTVRPYFSHTRVFVPPFIRSHNQQVLELLRNWMSEPDNFGSEWWDDFERELRENRLMLRRE